MALALARGGMRPAELVAAAIDYVALEGRDGVAVGDLMDAIEPHRDARMRRQVWLLLQRQHARGTLQFYHVITPAQSTPPASAGKKRKRPTGDVSHNASPTRRATRAIAAMSNDNGNIVRPSERNPAHAEENDRGEFKEDVTMVEAATENGETDAKESGANRMHGETMDESDTTAETPGHTATATATTTHTSTATRRESIEDAESIAYEDACPPTATAGTPYARRKKLWVVACEELRLRALNIPKKAILAEFGEDHLRILEAVGRARGMGITIPALCNVFGSASSVKKVHNSLDTLISYSLVVKRMMIVAKPTMRRLNIVHLPRFAAHFVPDMYDPSADFESDEQCKKILLSAAEAYLKELPTHSAVLYDLGRDLGFQKRHLEVLKSTIVQECKRDESFHLELFQAVLQPPKRGSAIEPKILNCVRYRPPSARDNGKTVANHGLSMETGLLQQIYGVIEENGDNGTTIIDLRNRMVLPGNKLPYKLVSILAGTYGLRAEAIILGKNKAFKLYPMLSDAKRAAANHSVIDAPCDDDDDDVQDITVIPSACSLAQMNEARYKRVIGVYDQRDELFSVRANLALKVALGGIEVEGTRTRRRDHILKRLATEKIISLSSLRASMFMMEKQHASQDQPTATLDGLPAMTPHVGMVDTRSVSRIANELEQEGLARLVQLPLPPRNVSTKFRALRCIVLPGYENDEVFIQEYVKNYGRDERLRRVLQNSDKNEVVRLRAIDSDDEDVPDFTLFRRAKKRARVEENTDASTVQESSAGSTTPPAETTEISYRVRSFVSQQKTKFHSHQYRRLGFAYGVMFRCKQFHQYLWRFLHEHPELHLRDEEIDISVEEEEDEFPQTDTARTDDEQQQNHNGTETKRAKPLTSRGIVFSRETILHRMPVYLYIQAFSGGAVLTATEFALVEHAVKNGLGFDTLPASVCAKVWYHESGRTSKVLGTLTDLKLIVPHKIGMKNLIKILRAGYTDDRDNILAQALKDNALGGLFRLRSTIRIALDDRLPVTSRSEPEHKGAQGQSQQHSVNRQDVIKLVATTEKTFSFGAMLPLKHSLVTASDVERYWEALEGLCVERLVMEVKDPKPNEPLVCAVPLPAKSRARRMLRNLGWIYRAQKPPTKAEAEPKVVKRTGIVSRAIRASRRRGPSLGKKKLKAMKQSTKQRTTTRDNGYQNGVGTGKSAGMQRQASSSITGQADVDEDDEESELILWSDEDERQLVDLFIENCRSRWKIPIPQGLQRDAESVAFRIPWLSRTGFALVSIARKLGKRKIDVKKRLKEKLLEPDAKLLLEDAKREMIETWNPSGSFEEERAIFESPRLTALFRRAVMMIVSPQEEYHPLVAEELISFWTAEEIRLVWRYLWLKNWIVRATERERIRGYSSSQRLQDFLKLTTLTYPLSLFQQAAEQEAMVSSTIDEVVCVDGKVACTSSGTNQHDMIFEAEFPANATPGQCALELGCQVMGLCSLVAVHSPIVEGTEADLSASPNKDDRERAAAMLARKRTLRFLNYKNQKEGAGFAGHLSKRLSLKNPAILTENWQVVTKMNAVAVDDTRVLREFEAFSTTYADDQEYRPTKKAKTMMRDLRTIVERIVRDAGEQGASLEDVVDLIRRDRHPDVHPAVVKSCVMNLVNDGVLVGVNAYVSQRYITKEHGDFWLLRTFSLVPDDEDPKRLPRVVFEGEKDTVSYPWLKMDGSVNFRFLYSIQRKLLSCVLLAPGVPEDIVCRRMDRLLTLQDTRDALALLVEDGLLYTRATATTQSRSTPHHEPTLFGKSRKPSTVQLRSVASHHLQSMDRTKFLIHYFPRVECVQRFGSIVQDYQNEVADGPRT